jgi:D-aminoacyl-tRNA deacylase
VRVVLQRVSMGRVRVEGRVVGEIGHGLVLLVGFSRSDDGAALRWMADKVAGLRVFADSAGRMNLALDEVGGELLVVSQFTLYGDARRGRRPSFVDAAEPAMAVPLYEGFVELLRAGGRRVATGEFGAAMQVELVNDGPVTLVLER